MADTLRKEPPLGHFSLPLLIDATGEALGADLLAMFAPVLVVVAYPPDARANRPLEHATRPPSWSAIRCAHRHLGQESRLYYDLLNGIQPSIEIRATRAAATRG